MNIVNVEGATRHLGAPTDWDSSKVGECVALPVVDHAVNGQHMMTSYWRPTEGDLFRLKRGAVISLTVFGKQHPPVAMDTAFCGEVTR